MSWKRADTELAPRDGRQILVAFRGETLPFWWKQTVFWDRDNKWNGLPAGITFSHWMELPRDPPE